MPLHIPYITFPLIILVFSLSAATAQDSNQSNDYSAIVTVESGNLDRLRYSKKDLSRLKGEYPAEALKFSRGGSARVAFRLSKDGRAIEPKPGGSYTSEAFYQAALKVVEQLKMEYIEGSWSAPVNYFVAEVRFITPDCIPEIPSMNIDLQFTICASPDKNAQLFWEKRQITASSEDSKKYSSQEVNCDSPSTTLEINECLSRDRKAVDTKLNEVYQKVMQAFSKPDIHGHVHYSEAKQSLIEAQRAWIKYRDKDCEAVYALAVGASMRGQLSLQCSMSRTEQRIKELEGFLDP